MSATTFQPDYRIFIEAARNRKPSRVPLYDHSFHPRIIEELSGGPFWHLISEGNHAQRVEGFRKYFDFGVRHGYDVMPLEFPATFLIQKSQGLRGHGQCLIHNLADVEAFPWDDAVARYSEAFDGYLNAATEALPEGMKLVGGVGNGVFEAAQDFLTLMELPFLREDEPEAYALLWSKIGELFDRLWEWMLAHHGDAFAVCRMGDDLGYRSSTMLSPDDIRTHIIPQYRRVVERVHAAGKPFLLHSCGRIFEVMDDIITTAGIDAKHSNEDAIAPFREWLERYNDRIAIFGGIDMDFLCRADAAAVKARTLETLQLAEGFRGFALGCGNSIADYVPTENFLAMNRTVREYRGA